MFCNAFETVADGMRQLCLHVTAILDSELQCVDGRGHARLERPSIRLVAQVKQLTIYISCQVTTHLSFASLLTSSRCLF